MSFLGPSLDHYLQIHKKLSLTSILIIANNLLSRIQALHTKNVIHRDLKPENILTSPKKANNAIYLVDFGLSKLYRDPSSKLHIAFRTNKSLTGTVRYASINNHLGLEQSRRDDLESYFYVIMHLMFGTVPW
jgi:serine/threonine protein kinase